MILNKKLFFVLLLFTTICFGLGPVYSVQEQNQNVACIGFDFTQCNFNSDYCEWDGSQCNNKTSGTTITPDDPDPSGGNDPIELPTDTNCDSGYYLQGLFCSKCPDEYPDSAGGEIHKTGCFNRCTNNGITHDYYYNDGQTVPCVCLNSSACQSSQRCMFSSATGCSDCLANTYLYFDPQTAQPSCESCPANTPLSPAGSIGVESCTAAQCNVGYYYNTTTENCQQCTQPTNWYAWTSAGDTDDPNSCGFSCIENYYANLEDARCDLCSSLSNGSWAISSNGTTDSSGCYTNCSTQNIYDDGAVVGTKEPSSDKAYFPNNCQYLSSGITCILGYTRPNSGTGSDTCVKCTSGPDDCRTNPDCEYTQYTETNRRARYCPWQITCHGGIFDEDTNQCQTCSGAGYSASNPNDFIVTWDKGDDLKGRYLYYQNGEIITPPTCNAGTYTITLNTNVPSGASVTNSPTTAIYLKYGENWLSSTNPETVLNNPITTPTVSTAVAFDGYYTDPTNGNGSQIIDSNGSFVNGVSTTQFASNTTLYAHWGSPILYTLTINNQTFNNCRGSCDISGLRNTCNANGIPFDSNGNFSTAKGTITKNNSTLTFTPNNDGNATINSNGAIELENIGEICPAGSYCDHCDIYSCPFGATSGSTGATERTQCKYFTNQTPFKDKHNDTPYKLPVADGTNVEMSQSMQAKLSN